MKTNRMLNIRRLHFNLPNDFSGTLGQALYLLANYALHKESYDEIQEGVSINEIFDENFILESDYKAIDKMYKNLIKRKYYKCGVAYSIGEPRPNAKETLKEDGSFEDGVIEIEEL